MLQLDYKLITLFDTIITIFYNFKINMTFTISIYFTKLRSEARRVGKEC